MNLDELTAQLKALLAGNPGDDLQKNLRATLSAGLARMVVLPHVEQAGADDDALGFDIAFIQ